MKRSAIVAITLVLLGAACGSGEVAPSPAAEAAVVEMRLIAFRPEMLDVSRGTTVTWKQLDAGSHTVTSGRVTREATGSVVPEADGAFSSPKLAKGDAFEHTFVDAGTYEYFCEIHPATMSGLVTVQ